MPTLKIPYYKYIIPSIIIGNKYIFYIKIIASNFKF